MDSFNNIEIQNETYYEKHCSKCTRKLLEELIKLRRVSIKLDAVIESSYDGIYITDGKANTLRVNSSYEKISGISREALLGKNMYELVKDGYMSQSGTLKVLQSKETITIQQSLKNGKIVLITSTPIFDKRNNIDMVVTNVRDITNLIKLQNELQENKKKIEKYFNEISQLKKIVEEDDEFIFNDHKTKEILIKAKRVAIHDTTVMIVGDTGTGKEVMARFIHKNSRRKKKPFIKVNCAAIPENLIESELFGYEKGAFTGANTSGKIGMFEMANKGTIFLDEIGELPLSVQAKLLRVIQEQEIQKLGSIKTIKIDVRIITATNRNLEKMIEEDKFREDLYYRLNIVPIKLPPLKERQEDIIPLAKCFLSSLNEKYKENKVLSKEVMNILYSYEWPGNVRELKNIIERAFVMGSSDIIETDDLPDNLIKNKEYMIDSDSLMNLKHATSLLESKLIKMAYEKTGNVREAAKLLGIDSSTFVRKRQKYEENGYLKKRE